MNIPQRIIDNVVCYSHVAIRRVYKYCYQDELTISYRQTTGFCKKRKEIADVSYCFDRTDFNFNDFKKGFANPETLNLIALLNNVLDKKKSINAREKLMKEYTDGTDDFSLGVIFALEKMKEKNESNL